MNDGQYRAFLDLMMCSDPWPLDDAAHRILDDLADNEAQLRGFSKWTIAYHDFVPKLRPCDHVESNS